MGNSLPTIWLHRLEAAAEKLRLLASASSIADGCTGLADSIRSNRRMVSVFGAFSAGKSSLINALLEHPWLVVSPNPTTASITEVSFAQHEGDTAITFKTAAELWTDVQAALAEIHHSAADLSAALHLVKDLRVTAVPSKARPSLLFLKSVAAGYAKLQPFLGETLHLPWAEARPYTSEERYASFVQGVQLACPAPLLQTGFCLIDTPGVDSKNRRHTDVSFHYMRRADAIVFVIYYTHAFSRADKDFLLQLAGVQDVVGRDKLFVIINAVDLATSVDERMAVRQRVEAELRQFGLRQPRVFEVSSQLASAAHRLSEHPADADATALLRQRLGLAVESSLPPLREIAREAGLADLQHALTNYVDQQTDALVADAGERLWADATAWLTQRARWLDEQSQASQDAVAATVARRQRVTADLQASATWLAVNSLVAPRIDATDDALDPIRLLQIDVEALVTACKELSFHASERIRFRLPELVREAFHPGRFLETSQVSQRLGEAATELADWLTRQWSMERRTTILRTGVRVHQLMKQWIRAWSERMEAVGLPGGKGFVAAESAVQDALLNTLDDVVKLSDRQLQPGFRHFTSAKQFFEGAGQKALLTDYEVVVKTWLSAAHIEFAAQLSSAAAALIARQLSAWADYQPEQDEQALADFDGAADRAHVEAIRAWFTAELSVGDMQGGGN